MPKSKEFIDNTDSENEKNGPSSEEETTKSAVSKKSKAKTKNDVSSSKKSIQSRRNFVYRIATS